MTPEHNIFKISIYSWLHWVSVTAHGIFTAGRCLSAWACSEVLLPHSTWDLSSPSRIKPLPPALEGRFSTTRPPGKPLSKILKWGFHHMNGLGTSILWGRTMHAKITGLQCAWPAQAAAARLVWLKSEWGEQCGNREEHRNTRAKLKGYFFVFWGFFRSWLGLWLLVSRKSEPLKGIWEKTYIAWIPFESTEEGARWGVRTRLGAFAINPGWRK